MKKQEHLYNADGSESKINHYLDCRDGIVSVVKFRTDSGYGSPVEAYLCEDTKYEVVSLVVRGGKHEYTMDFDTDSWKYIEELINGKGEVVRSYMENRRKQN